MFKSLKNVVSDSESAALSISNVDDEDQTDEANALPSDPQSKPKDNKSANIIRSISSNIKEKLQKKKFHRLELDDRAFDSIEEDINNEDGNNPINSDEQKINLNNEHVGDRSYSQLEIKEQIQLTQINNNDDDNSLPNNINTKYSNDSLNDEDDTIELSQLSNDDDGNDIISPHKQIAQNQFEDTYSFCVALQSIYCHLLTMIFVSFTQIMVSYALYIIVPLHVTITLKGDELLTGLIFLNYGFAYLAFNIFGNMCSRYYGSTFTILLSIFLSSLSLLFMAIFTDYFVWLMMMFCQGISFALFSVGSNNFIIDNISIKLHTNFKRLITFFNYIAMISGCVYAGNAIENNSVMIAIGVTIGLSLSGILFLCIFSIPPRYNDNSLVNNDSQQQQRGNNEDRIITKASITAWKSSYKQLSLKQRFSIFAWIKSKDNEVDIDGENTPIYELDDKLNTLQVFHKNASTILSILIFSFGLTFVRCVRLLIITFQCIQIDEITPSDIGFVNGISFLPEIILYILSSKILYTFGRRYTLIPTYLLYIISLLSLPYCNDKKSISYIALLFGVANGFSYGLIHKVAIDVAPTDYRDTFLAIYHTFTNLAYIVAPIFIALLIQVSSIEISCICSAIVITLSSIWSLCVMTDPKKTGKRYEHIDFEKSYVNEEISLDGLINGKHIGPPINKHKIKMELHSIDSVMERDSVAGNDTNVETKNDSNNNEIKSESKGKGKKNDGNIFKQLFGNKNDIDIYEDEDEDNTKDNYDDYTYVDRIANKPIGNNIKLGQCENQYKFEIGHFDEEEEEESIMYELTSSDED